MNLASNSRIEATCRSSRSGPLDAFSVSHAASNAEPKSCVVSASKALCPPAETLTHARMLRVRARLLYPIEPPDVFAMAVSVGARAHESGSPSFSIIRFGIKGFIRKQQIHWPHH